MSNRLDDRMRALVAELVESAPEPPPLPTAALDSRVGKRSGSALRVQRLALATTVLVFIVGSAVGISTLLSVGSDDRGASETTQTQAVSRGQTTTVIASETTSATTAAPATTFAAAETTPVPTVPSDPRAAAVVALEVQCPSLVQTLTPLFEQMPTTPETYTSALDSLEGELFGIQTAIAILGTGDEHDQMTSDLDAVKQQMEAARAAGVAQAVQSLPAIDAALTELASSLVSFGATPCNRVATVIP